MDALDAAETDIGGGGNALGEGRVAWRVPGSAGEVAGGWVEELADDYGGLMVVLGFLFGLGAVSRGRFSARVTGATQ